MALTSAMYTALSGLHANRTRVETIGHNIANVNTTAFKGSRTLFQTQFSELLSMGTPPGEASGGTNPMQIGRGVAIGTTQRLFGGGSVETTGQPSDLAIEGDGLFVVRTAGGQTFYTRDGAFALNATNQLVTADGYHLMGYGVDQQFNVTPGALRPLEVPLGRLNITSATQNVALDGDLSAAEQRALSGSIQTSQLLVDGGGGAATAGTLLTDLRSSTDPGGVQFAEGDVIRLAGAARGERVVPTAEFIVGTNGSTLGDFARWLETQLGIQTGTGLQGAPGVFVDNGALVIRSNAGEPNAIQIASNHLTSSNASRALPFTLSQTATAQGTGVYTSFTVYDSLGNPVQVNATFTLESTPNTGPVWRYLLDSPGATGGTRVLGSGIARFNTDGTFVDASGNEFTLPRDMTGAATPITFRLNLAGINGQATSTSNVVLADQDGYPAGTLTSYAVGVDGTLSGIFSNGLTRPLGQVVLARFANNAGLVAEADNLFSVGPNSGPPALVTAGTLGAGLVRGGALEGSNVDLSREFIGLITSSTAFQANSRVISVSNEMLDSLLVALR
ncbi:MAG: flagellar hook-basal body complex protein [Phycisphaerales bacterium]|nr:flagellar hook-basal body complex protein [Phycisphaerales bacterium]